MAAMEQSMMDFEEQMNTLMERASRPMALRVPEVNEDEEFFKDLPVTARKLSGQPAKAENTFSSYSYSSSSVLDENGKRVESLRRRYEDSEGRLKAEHTRRLGDKTMVTSWNRLKKEDDGEHKTIVSDGTTEEFEKAWKETPFAKSAEQKSIEPETPEKEKEKKQAIANP